MQIALSAAAAATTPTTSPIVTAAQATTAAITRNFDLPNRVWGRFGMHQGCNSKIWGGVGVRREGNNKTGLLFIQILFPCRSWGSRCACVRNGFGLMACHVVPAILMCVWKSEGDDVNASWEDPTRNGADVQSEFAPVPCVGQHVCLESG